MKEEIMEKIKNGIINSPIKRINLTNAEKISGLSRQYTKIYLLEMELKGILEREEELKKENYIFTWWKLKDTRQENETPST